MKINYRIILINFVVVLLVLPATAILYYSILSESLTSLQKKNLSISLNNFINVLHNYSQQLDGSFYKFYRKGINSYDIDQVNLDFIYLVEEQALSPIFISNDSKLSKEKITTDEFSSNFSNLYVKKVNVDNKTFIYGKIIDSDFLDAVSQKINADVVLFSDKVVIDVSNSQINQALFFLFFDAITNLYDDKGYKIFSEESNSANILATLYKPLDLDNSLSNISFLIFNKLEEYSFLKDSLKNILIIIGIAGISLSVLLSYIFTASFRRKINQLSGATELLREGNYNIKVSLKGNDELNHLGETFNLMVEKIRRNQKILSDYSDFITLLNQKSTLKEIAEIALSKIIDTCGFSIGAIYIVDGNEIKLLLTRGINVETESPNNKAILNQVVESKNKIILNFDSRIPSIKTGLLDIQLDHLILQPVIYSDKVVAILELVSQSPLTEDTIDYLDKIQEQLAIGLINARAVQQLEDYVNELKKLNEDLKNSNNQIVQQNEMLIKLSEALQNQAKELSIQKEKAVESTKLKSQFLASISHELKTPLNSIIGLTELIIEKSEIAERDKERLRVIQRSGKRLVALINDLLDFSQIESGKFKPSFSSFTINDFLDELISEIEPLALNKKLKLIINRNYANDFELFSDKQKLHQVLFNIIGNAIKFTQEGQVEFTIEYENTDKVLFIISDTGIGIEDSQKEIIFEEFRQADGSLSKKFGGTGLGLSISKKIIELLGGRIWFESKIGVGTTFYVELPCKNSISKIRNQLSENSLTHNLSHKSNLVLVVDDDPDSLFTITEILNSHGFNNTVARGGQECLKILENVTPDLILLDIMMPEMDGFQTIKRIRTSHKHNNVKIFAVTAKAMENALEVIKNSGFDDCVFKPINSKELINKISYHLNLNLIYDYEKNINN
jgi:signal transduction histidine kinase/CheY-like chemotaxis protein